jgi:hypothetical protein
MNILLYKLQEHSSLICKWLGTLFLLFAFLLATTHAVSIETNITAPLQLNAINTFTTQVNCTEYSDKYKQGDLVYYQVKLCYADQCLNEINKIFAYKTPCPETQTTFMERIPAYDGTQEITKIKIVSLMKRFDMVNWDIADQKDISYIKPTTNINLPYIQQELTLKTQNGTIDLSLFSLLTIGILLLFIGAIIFMVAKPAGLLIAIGGIILLVIYFLPAG